MNKPSPESPAKEQPGEQNAAPLRVTGQTTGYPGEPANPEAGVAAAAPDVAAMVKRLRDESLRLRSSVGWTIQCALIEEAAALIEKLGQGWIPSARFRWGKRGMVADERGGYVWIDPPPPPERP